MYEGYHPLFDELQVRLCESVVEAQTMPRESFNIKPVYFVVCPSLPLLRTLSGDSRKIDSVKLNATQYRSTNMFSTIQVQRTC